MWSILFNWLLIAASAFPVGFFLIVNMGRLYGRRDQVLSGDHRIYMDPIGILVAGLCAAGVYAQVWSLFYRVSLAAIMTFFVIGLAIYITNKKQILAYIRQLHIRGGEILPSLALIIILALATSTGYMHYDSNLYHAQTIRWIEEYGVVKGLANLHNRLGYNSAAYPLTALYSLSFNGQSMHTVQGFLALLLWGECLKIMRKVNMKPSLEAQEVEPFGCADIVRVAGLFYLFTIMDKIVAPASDYFAVLLAFYIIIRFLSHAHDKEQDFLPYVFLSILAAFVTSIKLSCAPLVLICVWPLILFYSKKDVIHADRDGQIRWIPLRRNIRIHFLFCAILFGLLSVLPYLIRNVIISGYLVYPVSAVDMFHVAWKVPKGVAMADAREITVWGRGYADLTQYDMSIIRWFPNWFQALAGIDKIFFMLAVLSIPVAGVILSRILGRYRALSRAKKLQTASAEEGSPQQKLGTNGTEDADTAVNGQSGAEEGYPFEKYVAYAVLEVVLILGFLFWLNSAPLMRYGCMYVYSLAAFNAGIVYELIPLRDKERVVMIASVLFLGYKALTVGFSLRRFPYGEHISRQQDYDTYKLSVYRLGDMVFYYPTEGDQTGYSMFPTSPTDRSGDIVMMGDQISDGFAPASR